MVCISHRRVPHAPPIYPLIRSSYLYYFAGSISFCNRNKTENIAHWRQQCHKSKFVIFLEKLLKVLKCYNFLRVQRRYNSSPGASYANCVTTLYLLKVHLQTFLSIPITQKCQILSCDTLVANERYGPLIANFMRRGASVGIVITL